MPNVKTAISLEQELLLQVGELADSMHVSRSRVFAMAAEEFVKHRRNEQITQKLDQVYIDGPTEEEQETLRRMRPTHRRLAGEEW
jgi:metal-responsive CopG/Arc/MetJ family transcriptional regulator